VVLPIKRITGTSDLYRKSEQNNPSVYLWWKIGKTVHGRQLIIFLRRGHAKETGMVDTSALLIFAFGYVGGKHSNKHELLHHWLMAIRGNYREESFKRVSAKTYA